MIWGQVEEIKIKEGKGPFSSRYYLLYEQIKLRRQSSPNIKFIWGIQDSICWNIKQRQNSFSHQDDPISYLHR